MNEDLLPRQIREDLVDWAVGDVLVDAVSGLAQGERELVTHAKQLAETDHLGRRRLVNTLCDQMYLPCAQA